MKKTKPDIIVIIQKSGIALIVRAGGMLTQYLFLLTVARLLGPGALGSFTISFTILQLTSVLALLGLDNLLIRKIAGLKASGDSIGIKNVYLSTIRVCFITSIFFMIVLQLIAPYIANNLLHKPSLLPSFRSISLALPFFVITTIHSAAFRGLKSMLGFTLFKTLTPLFSAIFIISCYYFNAQINPVTGLVASVILLTLIYFIAWARITSLFPFPDTLPKIDFKLIHESLPMMITGSVFFILNWMDNLIIGIYWPAEHVGIYDIAFKIASASTAVLFAMNAIQAPVFAEICANMNHERLREYVFNSTRILFIITAPITLILLIATTFILSVFGNEFISGKIPLQILCIGNFFNCITGSVGWLLMMSGFQREYNIIVSSVSVFAVLINFLLVPHYGITGAAFASSLSKILWNTAAVILVYKKFGIISIYIPGLRTLLQFFKL